MFKLWSARTWVLLTKKWSSPLVFSVKIMRNFLKNAFPARKRMLTCAVTSQHSGDVR